MIIFGWQVKREVGRIFIGSLSEWIEDMRIFEWHFKRIGYDMGIFGLQFKKDMRYLSGSLRE